MKIYEIGFRETIGFLTIFAKTEGDAVGIFEAWYAPRFERRPGTFTVAKATPARIADDGHLRDALAFNNAGVASFVTGKGWIVLPATMEEAGQLYIEHRPVRAFQMVDPNNYDESDLFVFAATDEDAVAMYAVWSKLHLGKVSIGYDVDLIDLDWFTKGYKQLASAALHGAIGVAGPSGGGFAILPPWHLAAGDL